MSSQPPASAGANRVTAGPASDAKTFAAAALMTFGAGMLVLVGYILAGGFGAFLGIIGAIFGIVWWKNLHDKVFPRDLPVPHMLGLAGVSGVLLLIVVAMT